MQLSIIRGFTGAHAAWSSLPARHNKGVFQDCLPTIA